uniref:Caspase recruitment domain-containing protein n=1 Tax=Terrapene triunguis TaxID=2587831 RepID=A0A674HWB8_9SAUR
MQEPCRGQRWDSLSPQKEIEAYDDRKGNEHAVWKLFDYLKCRSGWVKELVEALRKNRHHDLADRVQRKYDAHQVRKLPCSTCPLVPAALLTARPWGSLEHHHGISTPCSLDCEVGCSILHAPAHGDSLWLKGDLGAREVLDCHPLIPTDGLALAAVHLSPGSPAGHLLACGGVPRGEVEVAQPGRPVPDPRGQSQDWAGRQQHPVCVSGGYFGNMNHLNVGNSRKASVPGEPVQRGEPAAAPSPEDFMNQPEEVYYSSFERSPLASGANKAVHGDGQQAGDSLREQKIQALQGYENGNLTSSMVDVHDPLLLQTQFDAEQKRAQGQRDHGGERDAFPLHQIRDSAPSTCSYGDVGLKSPVQERELPTRDTDSSSTSMPKENVGCHPPAPNVTRTSPGIPGSPAGTTAREAGGETQNALPGPPGGCQVFYSEPDEEVALSKPGVLISTGGVEEPATRQPESPETNVQYSGRSDRFILSRECSQDSNPLMISESSSPEENHYSSRSDHRPQAWAASNGPRRDEATKTSRASLPPENSSTWDSTAVGTHEVYVVECPSADLGEAPGLQVVANAYENPSPASSGSLRRLSGYSDSPWNSEDYILPAAVAAFTSVVAFLFYKHLRK